MFCRSAQREGATLDLWSKPCLYQTSSSKREGRLSLVQPHGYPETSPDTPKQTPLVVSVEEINSHDSQSEPVLFSSLIHVFLYVACSIKSVFKTMKAVVRYFDGGSLCS